MSEGMDLQAPEPLLNGILIERDGKSGDGLA